MVYEGGSVEGPGGVRGEPQRRVPVCRSHGDVWVSYILGAPEWVNREFGELFAEGVPPLTPLVARSEGPLEAN